MPVLRHFFLWVSLPLGPHSFLDVLVGLVEDHKLVELPPVVGRLSEHLQENHEQSERLVLLDELVAEVDDVVGRGAVRSSDPTDR